MYRARANHFCGYSTPVVLRIGPQPQETDIETCGS
jgi:hypothetical protein